MAIRRINHVGIAVHNLDKAVSHFQEAFGGKLVEKKFYEDRQMSAAYMSIGDSVFELMEPLGEGGLIKRFIEDRGEAIHHISLEVEDLEQTTRSLEMCGLKIMGNAVVSGVKLAYVHPKNNFGVLIELIQPQR